MRPLLVAALAILAMSGGVSLAYAIPVCWGLAAIFFAERGDEPVAAWTALAGSAAVAVSAAVLELRRRASA